MNNEIANMLGEPFGTHPSLARERLMKLIAGELDRAYEKHGTQPWGRHEFYAILKEELDELWDAIKADQPQEKVITEVIQVAAVCFRYFETNDRYRGPHPNSQTTLPTRN